MKVCQLNFAPEREPLSFGESCPGTSLNLCLFNYYYFVTHQSRISLI